MNKFDMKTLLKKIKILEKALEDIAAYDDNSPHVEVLKAEAAKALEKVSAHG